MPRLTELQRVREVYAEREHYEGQLGAQLMSLGDLSILQQFQKAVFDALRRAGFERFDGLRLLDVGCGAGGPLSQFLIFGALPEALFGVDILMSALQRAKNRYPRLHWVCADAQHVPLKSASFDLIIQETAFSSVLDCEVRKRMASEMLRVLKPEGAILWFDFFLNNPKNPDVRGIGKREIRALFKECEISFDRVILAPPLSRFLAPRSWVLCACLSALRFLNTHYLALIRRKG